MLIEDLIKLENNRKSKDDYNKVHLIKEGTFYRAHDWSAWLLSNFPIGAAIDKPLNVTATKIQSQNGYIDAWIGFPESSLERYIPNTEITNFEAINDSQIDFCLSRLSEEYLNMKANEIRKQVDEWKSNFPISESKKKSKCNPSSSLSNNSELNLNISSPNKFGIVDIFKKIISFSPESNSPQEAWNFLSNIKKEAINLL